MERRKIVITRLRNTEKWDGTPLNQIMDSVYYCIDDLVKRQNQNHDFQFRNIRWYDGQHKSSDRLPPDDAIKDADVLIIPTESEFVNHIKGRLSNIMFGRGWTLTRNIVDTIKKYPKKRLIILITSDKADTIELFKERTFEGCKDLTFAQIDEGDFDGNLHHLKYHFISEWLTDVDGDHIPEYYEKEYDFVYWGTSKKMKWDFKSELVSVPVKDWYEIKTGKLSQSSNKEKNELKVRFEQDIFQPVLSNDQRHMILSAIHKDEEIMSCHIGYFDGFKYDVKFDKDMRNIIPELVKGIATLCFNWPGHEKATTSRYNEAIACGIVPLVWKDYDKTNKLVYSDWQRCYHLGDVVDKLEELRDGEFRGDMFAKIFAKYDYVTKDKKYYTEKFNKKVLDFIKKLS